MRRREFIKKSTGVAVVASGLTIVSPAHGQAKKSKETKAAGVTTARAYLRSLLCAQAIKPKLVEMLEPKPVPYRPGTEV
jgi:hypothetical protein